VLVVADATINDRRDNLCIEWSEDRDMARMRFMRTRANAFGYLCICPSTIEFALGIDEFQPRMTLM
jgi:hypothetical protein